MPPDEAKKKARANLAEWKRHKAAAAITEKRELSAELLWTIDGYDGFAEARLADMRAQNPDWYKDGFDIDSFIEDIHGPMMERAKELLGRGADPDHRGKNGTLLMMAAENGDAGLADLLIRHGADIDARGPGGMSALMRAAFYANTEVVRALTERGAAVDATDENGWTALMHAAHQYHPTCCNQWQMSHRSDRGETITHLLDHGADADRRNDEGKTALELAMEAHDDPDVVGALTRGR